MSTPATTRAAQLLALADPARNDREHERENAAVALARLILSHGLVITDPAEIPQQRTTRPTWKTISSKYQTRCRCCGGGIDIGERCAWMPGHGCTHLDCADAYDWGVAA